MYSLSPGSCLGPGPGPGLDLDLCPRLGLCSGPDLGPDLGLDLGLCSYWREETRCRENAYMYVED